MSFVSKLAGHFGQKSGLIGHWPADTVLSLIPLMSRGQDTKRYPCFALTLSTTHASGQLIKFTLKL